MIAFLKGTVVLKENNFCILDANGVGYRVFLRPDLLFSLKEGAVAQFFTHEYLRENERELYGFSTIQELRLFWKLITVSGVGPKMATHLLALGYEKLEQAIEKENLAVISSISGVGKKTAQKIILELRGKLKMGADNDHEHEDIYNALTNLGYSREEVNEAIFNLPPELKKIEAQIKAALKILGR